MNGPVVIKVTIDNIPISWHNTCEMKPSVSVAASAAGEQAEQRGELRQANEGAISLMLADMGPKSGPSEVRGRLMDHSANSFRVEHTYAGLSCGQMVQCRFNDSSPRTARVVWTRIHGERVESGFFVLP
jgi:hypothetical protein